MGKDYYRSKSMKLSYRMVFQYCVIIILTIGMIYTQEKNVEKLVVFSGGKFSSEWSTGAWGKAAISAENNTLHLALNENSAPWCGFFLKNSSTLTFTKSVSDLSLIIIVNGDKNSFGTHLGGQKLQINIRHKEKIFPKGSLPLSRFIENKVIDNDPATWQKIIISLDKFDPSKTLTAVDTINIQFIGAPEKNGIVISDIYFTSEKISSVSVPAVIQPSSTIFPELSQIDPVLIAPLNPKVTISHTGNYLINGKPRFLIGAQFEADLARGLAHRPGYAAEYNWIYDEPLFYKNAARLGFDTLGYFTPSTWTRRYDPAAVWAGAGTAPEDEAIFDQVLQNTGLPLYVDMTCEGWTHGFLATRPGVISADAVSDRRKSHFLRYSILHPDGIKLYKEMITYITERAVKNNITPLFYELFNEPGYWDDNAYNRSLFIQYLKNKYTDINSLNKTWRSGYSDFSDLAEFKSPSDNNSLFVDWYKFMELSFTRLCILANDIVRKIDPDARTCVQLGGRSYYRSLTPANGVNIYEVAKHMDVISVGTGGGVDRLGTGLNTAPLHTIQANILVSREGILSARFYQNLAEGKKPIHNGEFSIAGAIDRRDLINHFWMEVARGFDASYIFKWDKRAWDWKDAAAGKANAEKLDYMWLNPYAKPVDLLAGILDFKKELKRAEDIMVKKPRGYTNHIMLLISYPTERMAGIAPSERNEVLAYAGALEFGHWGWDVILEEQLGDGRLDNCKLLIMAGIKNVYPTTPALLEKYLERGGVIISALGLPACDEYDNQVEWKPAEGLDQGATASQGDQVMTLNIPQWKIIPGEIKGIAWKMPKINKNWQIIGAIGDIPGVLLRKTGSGKLWYINARFPDYALASLLGSILTHENIDRDFYLLDASTGELEPNVEIHPVKRSDSKAFFLFNWDLYSKLAILNPGAVSGMSAVYDPVDQETYVPSSSGVLVHLKPQTRKIVVFSSHKPPDNLIQVPEKDLRIRYATACENEIGKTAKLAQEAAARTEAEQYKVDLAKIKIIDIKPFCNRQFVDQKPDDGIGGWTDQGENSLRGVPDGMQTFCGVPFEIIRWDMNNNSSCIVLHSKRQENVPHEIKNIPIGENFRSLYFLHATGWCKKDMKVFIYRVNYSDGSALDIDTVVGKNIEDWWIRMKCTEARIAFKNSEARGFWCWKWENPHPKKRIQTIDIISAENDGIPIVIAISGEKD